MRRPGIGKRKCKQVRRAGQAERSAWRRLKKHWLLCRLLLFLAKYALGGPAFKKSHHPIGSSGGMDPTKKPMTLWRNMFSRSAAKLVSDLLRFPADSVSCSGSLLPRALALLFPSHILPNRRVSGDPLSLTSPSLEMLLPSLCSLVSISASAGAGWVENIVQ